MAEKDTVFSSAMKYDGIFSFKDFYKFCYEWLTEEIGLDVVETTYSEKLTGDTKDIEIKWGGTKKFTDYFKFEMKVDFVIRRLKEVEISKGDLKIRSNNGSVKVKVNGILIRDYDGKFERSGFQKFLRGIYEKWVITSRIEQFEGSIIGSCDEFLNQAKAYLDLEGRK